MGAKEMTLKNGWLEREISSARHEVGKWTKERSSGESTKAGKEIRVSKSVTEKVTHGTKRR